MRTWIGSIAALAALMTATPSTSSSATASVAQEAVCETTWPAPADTVRRAEAAFVPTYTARPTAYRAESRLSIAVNGIPRRVPAGIGVDSDADRVAAVTTEGCEGRVRVAAEGPIDVHLWQLFAAWGVPLSQHCIGGTCNGEGVRIVLDGDRVEMCPGAISIGDVSRIDLSID